MDKKILYRKMQIEVEDIEKGESLLKSYSIEMRTKFLLDIYGEYQPSGGFKSVQYLYGKYPDFRKVQLINIAISGSDNEKQKLARGLSNPCNNEGVEDFYELIYEWITTTNDSKVFESLSRGLMFYWDREEVQDFYESHIKNNFEFVNGVLSWLYIQPKWFREKYKDEEIEIWKKVKENYGVEMFDNLKVREINKKLGLEINKNEIWLHEIENPWNFSGSVIEGLYKEGINIKIDGTIGEFSMGSPLIKSLLLNDKEIEEPVGGPFLTDEDQEFLCCTTYKNEGGFRLVIIELKTNRIVELDSSRNIYTPYKFVDGEFIIIAGDGKIDLEKNSIKYNLEEIKTTHNFA